MYKLSVHYIIVRLLGIIVLSRHSDAAYIAFVGNQLHYNPSLYLCTNLDFNVSTLDIIVSSRHSDAT